MVRPFACILKTQKRSDSSAQKVFVWNTHQICKRCTHLPASHLMEKSRSKQQILLTTPRNTLNSRKARNKNPWATPSNGLSPHVITSHYQP